FGHQWINLNSYQKRPVLFTDTHLAVYMMQLKNDGYSLFVIKGEIPYCVAEEVAISNSIVSLSDEKATRDLPLLPTSEQQEQQQIEEALKRSLEQK
ncbi:hypothetical protein, partial [Salmonella sp. s51228]|uniref:hypothetical protein n=1 Tax=Salmonella sp. s51228 TaxID=3159652 RepID=UPI0039806107